MPLDSISNNSIAHPTVYIHSSSGAVFEYVCYGSPTILFMLSACDVHPSFHAHNKRLLYFIIVVIFIQLPLAGFEYFEIFIRVEAQISVHTHNINNMIVNILVCISVVMYVIIVYLIHSIQLFREQ